MTRLLLTKQERQEWQLNKLELKAEYYEKQALDQTTKMDRGAPDGDDDMSDQGSLSHL